MVNDEQRFSLGMNDGINNFLIGSLTGRDIFLALVSGLGLHFSDQIRLENMLGLGAYLTCVSLQTEGNIRINFLRFLGDM